MAYIAGSYQVNSNMLHYPSVPQIPRQQVRTRSQGGTAMRLASCLKRLQLRLFMNIREDQLGDSALPVTPPTPPANPDRDDEFLKGGAGEAACARDWEQNGYVALANFNQVRCARLCSQLHLSRFPQHFKITPACARMWSGVMTALRQSSFTLLKVGLTLRCMRAPHVHVRSSCPTPTPMRQYGRS
jgi:hypothetical protein